MLFDPFEEKLHLSAALVKVCNGQWRKREIVRQEHQLLAGLGVEATRASAVVEVAPGTGVERTPCRGIDRNMRTFLFDDCLDTTGRICRTRASTVSPPVVRKQFVPYTSATPSRAAQKDEWPNCLMDLKSKTVVFPQESLETSCLQQIAESLTGQY